MSTSNISARNCPSLFNRLYSVWYRHVKVYMTNFYSNAFPSFLEPLIFLAGVGLGLGKYITTMDHLPYLVFLATGLLMTAPMFTASFECTYGTFIRLVYDKVYDGMLAAPISVRSLFAGEILFAGTKGFFLSFAVMTVMAAFNVLPLYQSWWAPFLGFFAALMFASLSLFVVSFVNDLNNLNFWFTGFLSPMFFFSGVVFPVSQLPQKLRWAAEIFPLTHAVRLARLTVARGSLETALLDVAYMLVLTVVTAVLAYVRLKKRLGA